MNTARKPVELPTLNLDQLERLAVLTAIEQTLGAVAAAAGLLGITRHALRRRLVKFGYKQPERHVLSDMS